MDRNKEFKNPIIEQRADPWIYKHTDGYYYFTASVPEYDRIEIRKSKTIQELSNSNPKVVWKKHTSGEQSANIWAPEIHFINDKWYIYFAAARTAEDKDGLFDHRIYILENSSSDPLEGEWQEKGNLQNVMDTFSLDATSFEHNGENYLVWAQRDPNIYGNSNLYIAKADKPWSIEGTQVMISKPEYPWETIGFWVNEGPAVIKRNGKVFISYSASATDYNYCIGILSADDTSDLLNPSSWIKLPAPVFQTNVENSQYGPGHSCFTVSEDGTEDLLVYHCRNYKEIVGNPLYDPNRHTHVQVIEWNADGTPNFGVPVKSSSAMLQY